jgi:hypothetical protein
LSRRAVAHLFACPPVIPSTFFSTAPEARTASVPASVPPAMARVPECVNNCPLLCAALCFTMLHLPRLPSHDFFLTPFSRLSCDKLASAWCSRCNACARSALAQVRPWVCCCRQGCPLPFYCVDVDSLALCSAWHSSLPPPSSLKQVNSGIPRISARDARARRS